MGLWSEIKRLRERVSELEEICTDVYRACKEYKRILTDKEYHQKLLKNNQGFD